MLGVYLAAGLAGSLALVATNAALGYVEPSVGASAAFLGLVGALAVCPRDAWGPKLAVDKIMVVVLVIQLVPALGIGFGDGDWSSSAAHVVGLAVGATYGYFLRPRTTTALQEANVPAG